MNLSGDDQLMWCHFRKLQTSACDNDLPEPDPDTDLSAVILHHAAMALNEHPVVRKNLYQRLMRYGFVGQVGCPCDVLPYVLILLHAFASLWKSLCDCGYVFAGMVIHSFEVTAMKKTLSTILMLLGLICLILDSKTALVGAADGVGLCLWTMIPSLLPFFFLSNLLCAAVFGSTTGLLRPLEQLCRIPRGSAPLVLTGLLAGYPVGAQQVATAFERGQLNKKDAQRMLSFCSNAGPAFLFGILGSKFEDPAAVWLLWLVHILSALMAAVVLPGGSCSSVQLQSGKITAAQAAERSVKSMAKVCTWVILMRVVLAFLQRWVLWLVPWEVQISIIGFLELANGCCLLSGIANPGLRLMMASVFLAAGGLCVTLQTMSVVGGLGMGIYLKGKLLQSAISLTLSWVLQRLFFSAGVRIELSGFGILFLMLILVFSFVFAVKRQKKGSNYPLVGV